MSLLQFDETFLFVW